MTEVFPFWCGSCFTFFFISTINLTPVQLTLVNIYNSMNYLVPDISVFKMDYLKYKLHVYINIGIVYQPMCKMSGWIVVLYIIHLKSWTSLVFCSNASDPLHIATPVQHTKTWIFFYYWYMYVHDILFLVVNFMQIGQNGSF